MGGAEQEGRDAVKRVLSSLRARPLPILGEQTGGSANGWRDTTPQTQPGPRSVPGLPRRRPTGPSKRPKSWCSRSASAFKTTPGQVGAAAIAWEMEKLKVTPPTTRTIERILSRAGVPKRRARNRDRYVPKGTPYPGGPLVIKPNAVHEIDLVGPRHLQGARPSPSAWL